MTRADLAVIADLIPSGSRVLDLGCGNGDLLALLADKGCTGTGVDLDPATMLSCLRRGVDVIELDLDTQLSEFGDIDPGLSWDWNPLFELTDLELADLREKNARTDREYFDMGVVSGEQIAARLDADPSSGYAEVLDADADPLAEARDLAAELMAGGPGVDDPDDTQPDDLQVDAP